MSMLNQIIGESGDALGGISRLLRVDGSGKLRLSDPNLSKLHEPLDPNHAWKVRMIGSQERDLEDDDSVTNQSANNGSLIIDRVNYNKSFS
jgi:hypothetical protein